MGPVRQNPIQLQYSWSGRGLTSSVLPCSLYRDIGSIILLEALIARLGITELGVVRRIRGGEYCGTGHLRTGQWTGQYRMDFTCYKLCIIGL